MMEILSISKSLTVRQFVRQLLYKVYCIRYQLPLYLRRIKPAQKHSKLQKYYVTDRRLNLASTSYNHN